MTRSLVLWGGGGGGYEREYKTGAGCNGYFYDVGYQNLNVLNF